MMDIKDEELSKEYKSGANVIRNQIAWARNTLREAGLIDGSQHGVWQLTEEGWKTELNLEQALDLRKRVQALRAKSRNRQTSSSQIELEEQELLSEEIDSVSAAISILQNLTPNGFELFCQRLLRSSGFSHVEVTRQTGDGGIDGNGILEINEFVSFRVMFQCKRYQGSVSPKELRDFRGAMSGRTDKGIFLTTGTFTRATEEEASREGVPPIELVDGERLVELMQRLKLGMKERIVFDVDHAFFEPYQ